MKKKKLLTVLSIISIVVYLFLLDGNDNFSTIEILITEIFITIPISFFFLRPLSKYLSKDKEKNTYWDKEIFLKLFIIRMIIILLFYLLFSSHALIIHGCVSICFLLFGCPMINAIFFTETDTPKISNVLTCSKCGNTLIDTDDFCQSCGEKIQKKLAVNVSNFDSIYNQSEAELLEIFIEKELKKIGIKINDKFMPPESLKNKKKLIIFSSLLTFTYIALIFLHVSIMVYIIGFCILLFLYRTIKNYGYGFMYYLKSELRDRPKEKISSVIIDCKDKFVHDDSKKIFFITMLIAVALPLLIFKDPIIIYEKVQDGYGVRFYTAGLTNYRTAVIPETYKGKKVVSLRGETFANMYFLESVILPSTITEIKGDTFKYCGLKRIEIPDNVTRIGAYAFYGNTSLSEVIFTENSKLKEIGSSAFRKCSNLFDITIPQDVNVNVRAFKESPTTISYFDSYYNNNYYYDLNY